MTLLRALALEAHGDRDRAVSALLEALALAESGAFIRSFVDEGASMATVLSAAAAQGRMTDLVRKLLPLFQAEPQPQIDALSQREIEVLGLIAQGFSN